LGGYEEALPEEGLLMDLDDYRFLIRLYGGVVAISPCNPSATMLSSEQRRAYRALRGRC
jgi:hypothetical protein